IVSGANRGIGYGLASFARRPNTFVLTGAVAAAAQSSIAMSNSSRANKKMKRLPSRGDQKNAGREDVVIASRIHRDVVNTPSLRFREHFEVKTLGPVILFQASDKLLLASSPT
ncbi:hypothetical protein R3P38DRAFT_2423736, partial [Favolaschia claudopus]